MLNLQRIKIFVIPAIFGVIFVIFTFVLLSKFVNKEIPLNQSVKLPDVTLPMIDIDGQLRVPTGTFSAQKGIMNSIPKLVVISASLVGVYDKDKMTGVRILGEIINLGGGFVESVDPIIRFYDAKGKLIAQKIGKFTSGFDFKEIPSQEKTVYDVTIDSPPPSDRLEIVFNVSSSSHSASLLPLKIASKSMELKTTNVTSEASDSAAQKVDYYTISGKVVNTFSNLISDIVIYAWGRDVSGRVFAFGRADFKNDLLSPSDKVDFKIIMLPIRTDQKIDSYEIAAWGKEYKLLTSSPN